MNYSLETIHAASRVGKTFATGCDRCDLGDLIHLENAGLMDTRICTKEDEFGQDSLEAGETMYEFNKQGQDLIAAILQTQES